MRWLFAIVLAMLMTTVRADLEVIDLQHRNADELIPVLRPMLGEDSTLTGRGFQLVVKGSEADIQAVRDALSRLDTAAQDLMISVRRSNASQDSATGGRASGRVVIGDDGAEGDVGVRVYSTRDQEDGRQVHTVRAVAGRPAYIDTGLSVAITDRSVGAGLDGAYYDETTGYRDTADGFYATAQVTGERVQVEIRVKGEWITIAGLERSGTTESRGITRRTQSDTDNRLSIQLKVEALPPRDGS